MDNITSSSIPIAKFFAPYELRGWLKRSVSIPAGKTGVVIFRNGEKKILRPGKSLLLNPFTRLRGDGIGMQVGYVPADFFKQGAKYENLLTGDDELLDINLIMEVKVQDPIKFFTSVVVPVGEITDFPDLGTQSIHDALEKLVSQYEREDILRIIPTEKLSKEIFAGIHQYLPELGLELLSIPHLIFKRSEDRLLIEDKLAEIETRLGQAGATSGEKKKGDDISLEKIADDTLPGSMRIVSNEKKPLSDLIDDIQIFRHLDKTPRPHWIIRSLQSPNVEGLPSKEQIQIKKWRGMEFRWSLSFLAIGAVITYLIMHWKLDLNNAEIIGFLTTIWATVAGLIFTRLKKIVERQENLYSRSKTPTNQESPRYVLQEEKLGVENLVRQQCAKEFQHTRELMNESRERIFSYGNTELALKIKDFEKKLDTQKEKTQSSSSIAPYYLSDVPIRVSDWKKILDQEEDLLVLSKSLGRMAEQFRSSSPDVKPGDLEKLEEQTGLLEDRLYARSRLV